MKITAEQWREKSKRGEVCGILGCRGHPETKCPHCGCYYCRQHKFVIDTLAHGAIKQNDPIETFDTEKEAEEYMAKLQAEYARGEGIYGPVIEYCEGGKNGKRRSN